MSGRGPILVRWIAGPEAPGCPESLGAKASRLHDLVGQGIPVPPWIVLTAEAARAVLVSVEAEIERIVDGVPRGDASGARAASERIASLVRGAPWPSVLREELLERLRGLRSDLGLAVRSSAAGEDGAKSSYAGQFTSLLYVRLDGVEAAVQTCWASAWSDRAILYRHARGLPRAGLEMAVIIQEMVESKVSGVAFTADPLTGAPTWRVVAGYGLGEGIVSDQVDTDEFTRRMPHDAWQTTVRRKARRSVRRRDGEPGTEIVPVENEIQDQPALTVAQLDTLGRYLDRIESAAGCPQDVEWSMNERGDLYILQARPITASLFGRPALWDDGNIGESYPGITLPLTYSIVRLIYKRVFTRALRRAGIPRRMLERAATLFEQLVGTVDGRLYLNVLAFYRIFALVPGLEPTVRRWEDAFGVRLDDGSRHPGPANTAFRVMNGDGASPRRRLAALRTYTILALRFLTRGRDVRGLTRRMTERLDRLEREALADLGFEELLERFEEIDARCTDDWALVIFNDLYATYFSDRLARLCRERSARSDRATSLHHDLLRGETGMESVAPLRSVLALAGEARRQPEIASLLRSERPDDAVWSEILASSSAVAFRAMALDHIRHNDHRSIDELKFEAVSLHEAPSMLVPLLRNHLDLGLDTDLMAARGRALRTEAERDYRRLFRRNPARRWHALWILRAARRTVTDRENLAFIRTRTHALLRRLFRAMGDWLARDGALSSTEDIFYLRIEELRAYARGGLPESDLVGIVRLRRERYATYESLATRHRIACRGSVYRVRRPAERADQCRVSRALEPHPEHASLWGVPCAPGRVRGVARVVRTASPGEPTEGEILVAPATDPGWMFLMLAAKGLIVERGSVLSHTAIIGRELGVPTIVGVEDATERIQTGDEIEMDGGTGEIRYSRPCAEAGPITY